MIAAIETAILARLSAASEGNVLGYKLGTLENYPDDWEAHLLSTAVSYPAAWATFASFDTTDQLRSGARVNATFGIVVAAENLRNATAARHGETPASGPAEPGSLQVLEDMISLIQGQDFGLEIGNFELLSGQAPQLSDEVVKRGISLMATQWRTSFIFERGAPGVDVSALDPFVTFNSQWDAPPKGTIDAPTTDFTNQFELPQEETE